MKTKLIMLTLILTVFLEARDNPFEKYEEETGRMFEVNETPKTLEEIQEAEYIKKVQQEINQQSITTQTSTKSTTQTVKPVEKIYSKKEVDSLIQKTKQQNEQKAKELVKKELANVKKEPEQIVYVKPRADVETDGKTTTLSSDNGIKNILPFLNIEISDDKLIIKSEHTMFKKFSIDKENKLALDYRAKVSFTTKRENINSKNFKNIVIGNHQKGGYYRVAVELGNKPSKYSVDVKSGTVTISLK
ncbi:MULTISPECIES: AMIN domain-containing protein [Arcobacteraceae]|uniref:AMIN domain-containing protein n=1 Tax=Arcobacteraceae TaxID=2808963 RepID=UPI000DE95F16|nr:AMIN domain-containing protein [Arcobacter sp. CECT 9188]RBQ26519.1 hypothetical protein CRU88_06445 [Arcobacter sp. CECT 9188]